MYYLLVGLQYLGIAICLFEILYIMKHRKSEYQLILLGLMFSVLINCIGYAFELRAKSKELMIQAVKFSYIGKIFTPLILILFVLSYCNIKVPKIISATLIVIHCTVLTLVLSCERHTLFYSSIGYTEEGYMPHLVLKHGPIYKIYTLMLVFYFVFIPMICIIKNKKDKSKDKDKGIKCIILMEIVITVGLGLYISGITKGYDTTEIAYVISETILLYGLVKGNMLEVVAVAKEYIADNISQGLIILGKDNRVIFYNESLKKIYPNLGTNQSWKDINQIINISENNAINIVNDKAYRVIKHAIARNNTLVCTVFVLEDISSEYFYADKLKHSVEAKTKQIAKLQRSVFASFAQIVEARDGVTGQHVKRTTEYTNILANALAKKEKYKDFLDDQTIQVISDAAALHDIGKISIPDSILKKPGTLTEKEFELIKTHSDIGASMIKNTLRNIEQEVYLDIAMNVAHYHHEKWDGTGYPKGLKGEKIPVCARIVAVADVYDALCSDRSYKKAMKESEAYKIIMDGKGNYFDPEIVNAFAENYSLIQSISRLSV